MSAQHAATKKTSTLCHFVGPAALGEWETQALVVFADGSLDEFCQTAQPFLGWCIYRWAGEFSARGLPLYRLDTIGQSRQERGV